MSVKVSHLARNERSLRVPVDAETAVTIRYRPGGFTPETEDALQQHTRDGRTGATLIAFLADCLAGWDLVRDDGKALPITPDVLRGLPMTFLGDVVRAISEDMRPNGQSGDNSAAGS